MTINVTEMQPPEDFEGEVVEFGGQPKVEPKEEVPPQEDTTEVVEETTEPTDEVDDDNDEVDESKPLSAFDKQKLKWKAKVEAKDALIEQLIRNQQAAQVQHAPQQQIQAPSNEPTLEQFGGQIEAYTRAHSQWSVQQALAQQRLQSEVAAYQSRVAKVKTELPDFDQAMAAINNHPVAQNASTEVMNMIRESEVGPQIQYFFAKNLNELARIDSLPAHRRLIELGKLEDRLETKKVAPVAQKAVTRAPAAVKPNTGGSAPSVKKDLYSMSADEVADYLEAEERKNPRMRRNR